ncbi:SHOCT domain-containing protein [Enterococcus faecium]
MRKYKELLDDGIITEEEFNKKKQELLDFLNCQIKLDRSSILT